MDNPGAALPGWCSASGRLSRSRQLKRSARRLSDVGLGTSGTGAERSWEYRFNPCENRLTPRQNAQQIPDERELGTRPSFHHVSPAPPSPASSSRRFNEGLIDRLLFPCRDCKATATTHRPHYRTKSRLVTDVGPVERSGFIPRAHPRFKG